jgi:hypothetical protein
MNSKESAAIVIYFSKTRYMTRVSDVTVRHIAHNIQFNIIYVNCAFSKLIIPKEGNRALSTMPAQMSWIMARPGHPTPFLHPRIRSVSLESPDLLVSASCRYKLASVARHFLISYLSSAMRFLRLK